MQERLTKKEKKRLWKEAKKARRDEQKEMYRYAPAIVRFWNLYAKKPAKYLLLICIIGALVAPLIQSAFFQGMLEVIDSVKNEPVDKEEIYKLSPLDEEGGKKIDALPAAGKDDTWTICVYMIGSNLEDLDENDLSSLIKMQVENEAASIQGNSREKTMEELNTYIGDLAKSGLEMPSYFYYPEKPIASSEAVTEDVIVAESPGAASTDISEMLSDQWSKNIRIVIQTGGARRWSNHMINPNRTQRFLYENGSFDLIEDLPLTPSFEPDTLADFVDYCGKNYPADHKMLVLWNHGGGAFGYGQDSIYGGGMSMKDIRTALEKVYQPDLAHPAFDIIGFDACLMSSLEVTHALSGFAQYYALSEESEPNEGWDYGPWLKALSDDPTMNPAKVCRSIADSYMDFYMTQNVNLGGLMNQTVTFSVLDAKKCEELYAAYCDLAKAQLIRAADDISVLTDIGRCADKSIHLLPIYYNIYNTLDLGNYVDYMVDTFPEESSRVKNLISEAVLYHRENGSISDSNGISVYIPSTINNPGGLMYFLDYVNNICEDDSTRALYYYKVAGCLNEELGKYTASLTKSVPKVLNTAAFKAFSTIKPAIDDEGFSVPAGEELQSMIQKYELEISSYDKETNTAICYGRDDTVSLDGEGNVDVTFDGQWFSLDGVPLAAEVASSTDTATGYRSKVLYNGVPSYLVFSYDRDSEEITIEGIREIPDPDLDPVNYLIATRSVKELEPKKTLVPLYMTQDFETNEKYEEEGKSIKIKKGSRISLRPLPDGYYLTTAVISDQRGEDYYSAVVGNQISGGKVKKRKVDKDFFGRDY